MRKNILDILKSKSASGVLVTTAILFLIAWSHDFAQAQEAGILRHIKMGDKLPSINLPTINDNSPHSLTPGKGKPAVIMFFSVRPDFRKKRSLALLSTLSDLAAQYKTKLDIIGIFSDDTKKDTVNTYMAKSNLNITVYNDDQKEIYNKYGVFMMPLVLISDSDGKLHEVIPYNYNIREIVNGNIKLLLGEWNRDQLVKSLKPKEKIIKSQEEKEYIRRINYGRIMQSKKMYKQAIRELSNAAKLMPQLIEAHIGLGFSFLKTKKYDKAVASFSKALKINPESDDAIAGLGLAYYGLGKIDSALVELEKAFIAPNPRLEAIITLAEIYEKRGSNDKANRLNKLAISRLMTMYEQRWK